MEGEMKRMTLPGLSGRDLVLAGAYLLLAAGWLLSNLLPVAWELALAAAFLLSLVVAALLWWTARRQRRARPFTPIPFRGWDLLAAGWTVGLAVSVAWGAYEVVAGHALPGGSWFGELYVVRYGLVMAAFGRCLSPWTGRRWAGLAGIGLLAVVVTWCGLLWPTLAATGAPLSDLLAYGLYPFLDVVVLGLAVWAWRVPWRGSSSEGATGGERGLIGLLLLAMIAYGAANWINLIVRGASYDALADLPACFWAVSDMLAGLAALKALWVPQTSKTSEVSQTSEV